MTAVAMTDMRTSAASMPGEVLSPSQASTFLSCSAKWWFRYGLGLPDPPSGGAVRGKAVHKLIEYAMRAKIAGVLLEPGALSDAWDAAWDQAAEEAEFQEGEDIDALQSSGARLAQRYVAEALPAIEPAAAEVPFSGTIAGIAVRGIADIVTTDGTVIDVKTSTRKPSGVAADHALPDGREPRAIFLRCFLNRTRYLPEIFRLASIEQNSFATLGKKLLRCLPEQMVFYFHLYRSRLYQREKRDQGDIH